MNILKASKESVWDTEYFDCGWGQSSSIYDKPLNTVLYSTQLIVFIGTLLITSNMLMISESKKVKKIGHVLEILSIIATTLLNLSKYVVSTASYVSMVTFKFNDSVFLDLTPFKVLVLISEIVIPVVYAVLEFFCIKMLKADKNSIILNIITRVLAASYLLGTALVYLGQL